MEWDGFGKPIIINYDFEVAITHCRDMVGVIVGDRKTGIDIEQKTDKIVRIARKFVNDKEAGFIEPQHRLDYLLVIWACKETLFKYVGGGGIDFKAHLHVQPFKIAEKGVVEMKYTKNVLQVQKLHYEWVDDHILVYCI